MRAVLDKMAGIASDTSPCKMTTKMMISNVSTNQEDDNQDDNIDRIHLTNIPQTVQK